MLVWLEVGLSLMFIVIIGVRVFKPVYFLCFYLLFWLYSLSMYNTLERVFVSLFSCNSLLFYWSFGVAVGCEGQRMFNELLGKLIYQAAFHSCLWLLHVCLFCFQWYNFNLFSGSCFSPICWVSILFSWRLISCLFYFLNLGKIRRLEGIEGRRSSLLSADTKFQNYTLLKSFPFKSRPLCWRRRQMCLPVLTFPFSCQDFRDYFANIHCNNLIELSVHNPVWLITLLLLR